MASQFALHAPERVQFKTSKTYLFLSLNPKDLTFIHYQITCFTTVSSYYIYLSASLLSDIFDNAEDASVSDASLG